MTQVDETRRLIAGLLREMGFKGRGALWRLAGSEVGWIVRLERPPYGTRLVLEIGADTQLDNMERRPTDCALVLYLDNLALVKDLAVVEALDFESRMDTEVRQSVIEEAVQALAGYLTEHLTFASLQDAYRAGDFQSAFIHKDLRRRLEAPPRPPSDGDS